MKAFIPVIAGLLSAVAALNGTESSIESRQNVGCAKGVHIIALGGAKTTDGDLGYLSSLAYSIRDSIRGSTLSQIGYPAGSTGPDAIAYGVPALRSHIVEYSAGCPKTPIVIAGYSVGATISMNVFCGSYQTGENALPNKYRPNILANVIYGDLTFIPSSMGPSYVRGTCRQASIRPRQRPSQCFPYGRKTRSFCDADDVECCAGGNPDVHFSYPAKYDKQALDFVVARYKRRTSR